MELILVWWFVCGLVGMALGNSKGRPEAGCLWGFLLGPIGWLILLAGGTGYVCPACLTQVRKEASICPACRSPLSPLK